ncbi:AAA family ATPase [Pseudomonas gingeri]|uniref:AAA family ATPase n=1 Tax=Pseudomonas gingeri TaxID=117681 RepID=UPI0015A1A1C4|nr:AAA family ATPase [Pseudomonas gingeri]NWA05389.1 AAA family ATPase [Pseudomonas gingeri]NWA17812.1 AAA family ATPase [Pseudomonas gingeri]NWA57776.1 AAA family ATPase [Pseudomonas gingeri]NWA98797.1 AAA family ATPase [Pseudomonas gingeri]NWB05923.1 AAA family ATPase [Pseudomonas gingeri]
MSKFVKIEEIFISKLYGIYNHKVSLRDGGVTIIHGANGVGKTAVLKCLKYLFEWNIDALGSIPFRTIHVGLTDEVKISISREPSGKPLEKNDRSYLSGPLEISFFKSGSSHIETISSMDPELLSIAKAMAESRPWLKEVRQGLWFDENTGEPVDVWDLAHKFIHGKNRKRKTRSAFFEKIRRELNVKLIDTYRLAVRGGENSRPTVDLCAADMIGQIEAVSAEYAQRSQTLDQSFPHRLIAGDHEFLSPDLVSERLKNLEAYQTWLSAMGLLATIEGPSFPSDVKSLSPGKIETMSLFVQDSESKLSVFGNLAEKCFVLSDLLRVKLAHKRIIINKERGLSVVGEAGGDIPLSSLSSGEQHEIVLMYELLFKTPSNSLLLIDEPEISLHVKWQKSFIQDLKRIRDLVGFDALIATHSPFIVGDFYELMESLDEIGEQDDY